MSAIPWLVFLVALIITVNANTEKLIFLGPSAITIPNVHPGLDDLQLDTLSPTGQHTLETQLSVKFPTEAEPRGVQSWYLIEGLQEGRRYELRICWVATVSKIIICLSVIPCELPPTLPNCLCLSILAAVWLTNQSNLQSFGLTSTKSPKYLRPLSSYPRSLPTLNDVKISAWRTPNTPRQTPLHHQNLYCSYRYTRLQTFFLQIGR